MIDRQNASPSSPSFTNEDRAYMSRALSLAERALYTTSPNPRVGCVIVRDGSVVGEGWHERPGGAHAEANALAQARGEAAGATVYVTLEPCNHFGHTPPCVNALIESKVARIVAAIRDPNPIAQGGFERLREAGIRVESGLLNDEARELNIGFFARLERGRPWLRMKACVCSISANCVCASRMAFLSSSRMRCVTSR